MKIIILFKICQRGKEVFPDMDEDGKLIQKTPNKKGRTFV